MQPLQKYFVELSSVAGISENTRGIIEAEDFNGAIEYIGVEYPNFTIETIVHLLDNYL